MPPLSKNQEKIILIYRMIIGAIIGFSLFSMFHLISRDFLEPISATFLWATILWVIFSEWWSIEERTFDLFGSQSSGTLHGIFIFLNFIYLGSMVLLPLFWVLGTIDSENLALFLLGLAFLSVFDIPLILLYRAGMVRSQDWTRKIGHFVVFDVILAAVYLVVALWFGSLQTILPYFLVQYPLLSVVESLPGYSGQISTIIVIYAVESYVDWKL